MSAKDEQIGGNHYKSLKIQPVDYIHANGIGYMEGNVIKYVSRWRNKGGIADLRKAAHYINLLIEMEGGAPEYKSAEYHDWNQSSSTTWGSYEPDWAAYPHARSWAVSVEGIAWFYSGSILAINDSAQDYYCKDGVMVAMDKNYDGSIKDWRKSVKLRPEGV